MKELHELKERLIDELEDYGKKELSAANLQVIDTLAHSVKNLCKIMEDDEYSGRYLPYDDTRSYKRDSMGRYSRNDLTDKLHDLMKDAPDERTRNEIKRLIDKM